MDLKATHPDYDALIDDWDQIHDTYRGERFVKEAGTTYLPATSGMERDGMETDQPGKKRYDAYKKRAVYHEFYRDAVKAITGIMHRKSPVIELPARMEPMRERATVNGENLTTLLRRINHAQLKNGRIGLLVDVPSGRPITEALPFIVSYGARAIRNWDDGRAEEDIQRPNLVVLDESEYERDSEFKWSAVEKYRILTTAAVEELDDGTYKTALRTVGKGAQQPFTEPQIGSTVLDFIPFTFINSSDLVPEPDIPPLLGLSNLALAMYRLEADYRQALFLQGQDMLVVQTDDADIRKAVNKGEGLRVGGGSALAVEQGGDVKYVGVDSQGLPEMREALENDKAEAMEQAARLFDFNASGEASGDALRIRVASRTANLVSIARAGAEGLQSALRQAALWLGADPEEVVVEPNMDFVDEDVDAQLILSLIQARAEGFLSRQSVHRFLQKREVTDLDFEDEQELIGTERPAV